MAIAGARLPCDTRRAFATIAPMSKGANWLKKKIQNRSATIGIMGLGYVGLPLACEFAKAGFNVTGFEVDASKVAALRKGRSYIEDISEQDLRPLIQKKAL